MSAMLAPRPATAGAARVLIADDQTLFRSGLARLLEDDPRVVVVGEAADGAEAVRKVDACRPDVVLMDIRMPNVDGIEATRQILRNHPEVAVLILTTFDSDGYVVQALKAGASGYVLKDSLSEAIVSSVVAVMSGERVIANSVAEHVIDLLGVTTKSTDAYDGLTAREVQILQLVANGMPNKQIAHRLGISEKTVRNHVSNIYEKLGIYDRAHAVIYAIRKGLIEV
jgi:DNA-binding NarL/FixJ family response regulator